MNHILVPFIQIWISIRFEIFLFTARSFILAIDPLPFFLSHFQLQSVPVSPDEVNPAAKLLDFYFPIKNGIHSVHPKYDYMHFKSAAIQLCNVQCILRLMYFNQPTNQATATQKPERK